MNVCPPTASTRRKGASAGADRGCRGCEHAGVERVRRREHRGRVKRRAEHGRAKGLGEGDQLGHPSRGRDLVASDDRERPDRRVNEQRGELVERRRHHTALDLGPIGHREVAFLVEHRHGQ